MKLDSLSKIIIATGQINYMAVSIDSVNEQIKFIPDKDGIHKEGIEAKNEILADTVIKLTAIMEELGDLINNHDCICHIDTRVAKVPFEILIDGQDDTEKDYEDESENCVHQFFQTRRDNKPAKMCMDCGLVVLINNK